MELLFKKTLMFLRGRITISNNQSFFKRKMILTVHFIKIFNSDFMSTKKEVQKTVYQSCKTVLTDKANLSVAGAFPCLFCNVMHKTHFA